MNNKVYKFYVNTYSGIDFWIEVTNGLITKFTNVMAGEKTKLRLNELYLGKTINHFVEDYTQGHMKNIFCAVKSNDIVDVAHKHDAVESRISNCNQLIQNHIRNNNLKTDDEYIKDLRNTIRELNVESSKTEKNFHALVKEVEENTGFKNKVKI